jgi:hypothetical protein
VLLPTYPDLLASGGAAVGLVCAHASTAKTVKAEALVKLTNTSARFPRLSETESRAIVSLQFHLRTLSEDTRAGRQFTTRTV